MCHCLANIEFKKDIAEANRENIAYFYHLKTNFMFLISLYDSHCDVLGAIRMKKFFHLLMDPGLL